MDAADASQASATPAGGVGEGESAAPEARRTVKAPDAPALKERKPSPSGGAVRRTPAGAGAAGSSGKGAEAPGGAASKEKDIMKMVAQQSKKETANKADMSAIFVGTASCGKSTLLKLLNKDAPEATLALEYQFVRKTTDGRKDVAHLWEVGGGTVMQNLLDVPLTEASVKTATVVIVADLSKPEEVFAGVSYWLKRLRERLQVIDKKLKEKEVTAKIMDQLKERAAKRFSETANRFGKKQDDNMSKEGVCGRGLVTHTGVNVIIVGNKYDLFKESTKKDPEIRKVMARTLRFLAHMNGASLLYCSQSEDKLVRDFRGLLSQHLFKGSPVKIREHNDQNPLFMPAGADTLEEIGLPPALEKSAMEKVKGPLDLWKGAFEGYFCKDGQSPHLPTGPAALAELDPEGKFEEKAVDSALYHKDLELQLYRDSQKADQTAERRDARAGAAKPASRKPSTSASRSAAASSSSASASASAASSGGASAAAAPPPPAASAE